MFMCLFLILNFNYFCNLLVFIYNFLEYSITCGSLYSQLDCEVSKTGRWLCAELNFAVDYITYLRKWNIITWFCFVYDSCLCGTTRTLMRLFHIVIHFNDSYCSYFGERYLTFKMHKSWPGNSDLSSLDSIQSLACIVCVYMHLRVLTLTLVYVYNQKYIFLPLSNLYQWAMIH